MTETYGWGHSRTRVGVLRGAVIQCTGFPGIAMHSSDNVIGQYLASYDPNAKGGYGFATWTSDVEQAMLFPDKTAAYQKWMAVPTKRKVRPDGKPNRPLTAFTVEIFEVERER